MAQLILLRGARQLLTLRGPSGVRRGAALHDLGIIEDGSVLVRDGIIAAVGSTRRLENLKEARLALEIPAQGKIVMPGFVDASLNLTLDATEHPHKRKKLGDFYDDSLGLMRSCLQHGTLTADVKACGDRLDFHSDISALRKLASIGSNPVRMMRTWRIRQPYGSSEREANRFRETLHVLTRRRLIHFVEVTRESQAAIDAQTLNALYDACVGIRLAWAGGAPEELSSILDTLQPGTVCCDSQITGAEIEMLSKVPAIAVFPTGKEVFEGPKGAAPRRLADAGGAIALSSGYDSAFAASFSMQMSLSLAVVRLGLTPEQAFAAATINAAHAAGCAHLTGSLESGKQADMLILSVGDYREIPRQFGINHVEMAIRQGSIVLNRSRWRAAAN